MTNLRWCGMIEANVAPQWFVVPVWAIILWLNACIMCAILGFHVIFTTPMIFIPLALIMWSRERHNTTLQEIP